MLMWTGNERRCHTHTGLQLTLTASKNKQSTGRERGDYVLQPYKYFNVEKNLKNDLNLLSGTCFVSLVV